MKLTSEDRNAILKSGKEVAALMQKSSRARAISRSQAYIRVDIRVKLHVLSVRQARAEKTGPTNIIEGVVRDLEDLEDLSRSDVSHRPSQE